MNEKSCGAVVFMKKGNVLYLLLRYGAGHWDFVKGNMELNEHERDTAIRELEEETGIVDAHFIESFREKICYFYRRQGTTVRKEVVFFLIQSNEAEIKLSCEHIGYDWSDYQKAREKLTFRNAKEVLWKANELLKTRGTIPKSG